MNGNVLKTLSPEESTLLGNLKAIIDQLESLQGGDMAEEIVSSPEEASLTEKDIISAIKKIANSSLGDSTEEEMPDEVEGDETQKSTPVKKEDNGPTASDSADERVDPDTDVNDDNLSEVGKALLLLAKKNSIKKNRNNEITNAVRKAISPIAKKLQAIEVFNSNVLDALGFTDKVEKSLEGNNNLQSVQKGLTNSGNKPVQSIDATAIVSQLVDVIKSQGENKNQQVKHNNDWNGMQETRKNLMDAIPFIFENNIKRRT